MVDVLTVLGIVLAFGAIIGGQYLEGGAIGSLLNGPAALIVIGGATGAVMLQSPMPLFIRAFVMLRWTLLPPRHDSDEMLERIVEWSGIARREGLLGLESFSETESNPLLRKGLQLLVDGSEPAMMRNILEVEVDNREHYDLQAAKLFESMGGYTPTIGIIGAVMGLIQVMGNLSDPSKLGHGIAVAFVATIYGVGLANLLLIPIANKLKALILERSQYQLMIIEGLISISEGENPRNIESKLQSYLT